MSDTDTVFEKNNAVLEKATGYATAYIRNQGRVTVSRIRRVSFFKSQPQDLRRRSIFLVRQMREWKDWR